MDFEKNVIYMDFEKNVTTNSAAQSKDSLN